jgi:hypothetical protein
MVQSIHVHNSQNWGTRFMAVRSPSEKTVFLNMIGLLMFLQEIEIINKYDNYILLRMTYTAIDDILWPIKRI